MRRHRRSVMLAWLLGVALLALVWVIYGQASELLLNDRSDSGSTAMPDPPAPVSSAAFLAMPSKESLGVIVERPVFSETRRPSGNPGGTQVTPGDIRLAGVVISASERSALIQHGDNGIIQRLTEGGDIGGWMLTEITFDRIKIRRGPVEAEMLLDYKAPAPLTPRTESRREKTPVKPVVREAAKQKLNQPANTEMRSEEEVQQ